MYNYILLIYYVLFYFFIIWERFTALEKKMGANYKVFLLAKLNLFVFSSFFRQFCLFFFVEINAIYF